MQPSAPLSSASTIPVPDIDSDEPVAVIPTASVAPLDGPPDGERINTFTLATRRNEGSLEDLLGDVRSRVLGKPLTYVAAAIALGLVFGRVLR